MLSRGQVKLIRSLQQKKYRKLHNLFVVEGVKLINELLLSEFIIHSFFAQNDETTGKIIENEFPGKIKSTNFITENELKSISSLVSPNKFLAVVEIPEAADIMYGNDLNIVLDGIRDPGNLGTIIRIADWFDVGQVICSEDCADIYNPKTVQATMGSIFRIRVIYTDIFSYLQHSKIQKYAAVLDGLDMHSVKISKPADILIGNESEGLRNGMEKFADHHISIPRYGKAESLNAAVATALVLDWARRV